MVSPTKTQIGKANFIGFPSFRHPFYKRFPLATVWADQPQSLFSLSFSDQKPTWARLSGFTSALSVKATKAPIWPFNFPEMETVTSWFSFLAVHLHKQSLQTDEQSEPQELKSGKPFAPVQQAQSRRIFVESCDATAFGTVSTLASWSNYNNAAEATF